MKEVALDIAREYIRGYLRNKKDELEQFERIMCSDFTQIAECAIRSSGYVVDTLEAAIWCLMNTDNYKDCVLKAVNLGDDTDTVACVAGGLAGVYYGIDDIPTEWIQSLARTEELNEIFREFSKKIK